MTYEDHFWNAIGHGMSEDEADAYAKRKVAERRARLAKARD